MGEMADAVLEGLFCQDCGGYIDGDEPGHPRSCGCLARGGADSQPKKKGKTPGERRRRQGYRQRKKERERIDGSQHTGLTTPDGDQ